MPSFISCPGCTHMLTLPEDVVGQRAQCPRCGLEFDAEPRSASVPEIAAAPAENANKPAPQTAYVAGKGAARSSGGLFCILCGVKVAPNDPACPGCGCRIHELFEPAHRHPALAARRIQPTRNFLPIIGAFLIPLGVCAYIAGFIVSGGFRGPGSAPFVIGLLCVNLAGLLELVAMIFYMCWLYQAWRAVQREDDEYSPGLMVGLLFVPCFNFYWMFHAILGLSSSLTRELHHIAPDRAHGSGWVIALLACILALLPPFWPIAICLFVAWSLIADNAVRRLVRLHEIALREAPRSGWHDGD